VLNCILFYIGRPKYDNVCAKVAIVNHKLEVEYNKTTRMAPGEYHVTPMSTKINGITATSLAREDLPPDELYEEVAELLKERVVVTAAGTGDFSSLGQNIGDFDTFDIQNHWFTEKFAPGGVLVREPMCLKKIIAHYFPDYPFQVPGRTHDPSEDAIAVMKLFMEVYIEIKKDNVTSRMNEDPFFLR